MKKADFNKIYKQARTVDNENFTGIKQLLSGFYAVFISGVWVDAASANREQAEQKLKQFASD